MTTIAGRIATMTSATVIMLALLTGCVPAIPSPQEEEPPMSATLESAKQETVLLRDEIVALLPSDAVGEVRLVNEATLFDCTPGNYSWPGSATVVTAGAWDSAAYLRAVLASFDSREGWTATDEIESEQMVSAQSDDGATAFVSVVKGGEEVWVRAFSVCFPFDPAVGKQY